MMYVGGLMTAAMELPLGLEISHPSHARTMGSADMTARKLLIVQALALGPALFV